MAEETRKSSPLLIAGAWLVVVIPAGWGLSYTARNAAKLFDPPAAPSASVPAPSASAAMGGLTPAGVDAGISK